MGTPAEDSYLVTAAIEEDEFGNKYFTEEVPFLFRQLNDTILHQSGEGDTWWGLAGHYYAKIHDRPAGFWRFIAQFQPRPVVNPLLPISNNTIIYVPSPRTVLEQILDPSRRIDEVEM
jgi:hypothetical protein